MDEFLMVIECNWGVTDQARVCVTTCSGNGELSVGLSQTQSHEK
jgi:hypothetical protein